MYMENGIDQNIRKQKQKKKEKKTEIERIRKVDHIGF